MLLSCIDVYSLQTFEYVFIFCNKVFLYEPTPFIMALKEKLVINSKLNGILGRGKNLLSALYSGFPPFKKA